MRNKLLSLLAGLAAMSALVSCGSSGPEKVSALVTQNGEAAGIIIRYGTGIDRASVSESTYTIPGKTIAKVFVSDNNPFENVEGREKVGKKGGRFVVVLIKDTGSSPAETPDKIEIFTKPRTVDVSIRQVQSIRDISGKTINPWNNEVKAKESYLVPGGLHK